jgi:uncharacterized protein with GYD domain
MRDAMLSVVPPRIHPTGEVCIGSIRKKVFQEDEMAKYVVLMNWTDQGIKNAKDTVKRARAARPAFEAMGVQMREVYWAIGPYDIVAMVDAPDDEAMTKAGLALAMQGNLRSTTMRVFGEQEMEGILKGLP